MMQCPASQSVLFLSPSCQHARGCHASYRGGCRQKSYSAVAPACDPTDWAGKCPWYNSGSSVIGDLTALWSELRPAPQDGVYRMESVSGTVNLVKSSCLGRVG